MSKTAVIYHKNCYDGFTAAWVCRKALTATSLYGDVLWLHPMAYGDPLPDLTDYTELVIVDFSFPRPVMVELHDRFGGAVTCLDHHKTAQANCEGLGWCIFDMTKSGAGLAWDRYFSTPRPKLVDYVEDRDLWNWKLPFSREVNYYISSYERTFENWDKLHTYLESDLEFCATQGEAIARYADQKAKEIAAEAKIENILDYLVPVVNCPYVYGSDVANLLLEQHPEAKFAAYYFDRADGEQQWGLRCRDDFDVSEIAKVFGGGGHKRASGFVKGKATR